MITVGIDGGKVAYSIKHYNVDTEYELTKFNPIYSPMGTTAFVIETSRYFMLNGEKQWIEIWPYGIPSGSGTMPSVIVYDGGEA